MNVTAGIWKRNFWHLTKKIEGQQWGQIYSRGGLARIVSFDRESYCYYIRYVWYENNTLGVSKERRSDHPRIVPYSFVSGGDRYAIASDPSDDDTSDDDDVPLPSDDDTSDDDDVPLPSDDVPLRPLRPSSPFW